MPKNKKILYLAIILIVFGIVEFIKSFESNTPQKMDGIQAVEVSELDLRPYSASSDNTQHTQDRLNKVQLEKLKALKAKYGNKAMPHLTARKGEHSFSHNNKTKKVAKNKKDKKTKKKSNKEENKTAKAKKKLTDKPDYEHLDSQDSAKSSDADEAAQGGGAIGVAQDSLFAGDEDKLVPTTLEEWERLLLNGPNEKALKKFIGLYQVNMVSDGIFYTILNKMADDNSDIMLDQAIQAADLNPNAKSFQFLVRIIEEQPYGSKARNKAQSRINKYSSLSHLKSLETVLKTPNQSEMTIKLAAQIIVKTADHYLKPSESVASQDNSQTIPGSAAITSSNQRHFRGIIRVLEGLVQISSDAQIHDTAENTLNHLNSLINDAA